MDSYGCVNYQPDMPLSETTQSQIEKCLNMKEYNTINGASINEENRSMLKATYFSIRKDINSGKNLNFLLTEWSLLFTTKGFLEHFNELVGVNMSRS